MKARLPRRALQLVAVAACVAVPAAAFAAGGAKPVWVTGNCTHEQFKPKEIVLACADGNTYLRHLSWSSWSTTKAAGKGAYWVNTCKPSCAGGHFVHYPAAVALSKPHDCPGRKHAVFTRAVLSTSRKHPKDFTRQWTLYCPMK